jgi:phosphomannomutase/phosphoglucomutase
MWKTGHSLIKTKMKEEEAVLAGEMSGHFFFADRYFGYDDGIYAALRLLEIRLPRRFGDAGRLLHLHDAGDPHLRLRRGEVPARRGREEDLASRHLSSTRQRQRLPERLGLVRASSTQAVIVLRFEAATQEDLEAIRRRSGAADGARAGDAWAGRRRKPVQLARRQPSSWPAERHPLWPLSRASQPAWDT